MADEIRKCPKCGEPVGDDWQYCMSCGAAFASEEDEAEAAGTESAVEASTDTISVETLEDIVEKAFDEIDAEEKAEESEETPEGSSDEEDREEETAEEESPAESDGESAVLQMMAEALDGDNQEEEPEDKEEESEDKELQIPVYDPAPTPPAPPVSPEDGEEDEEEEPAASISYEDNLVGRAHPVPDGGAYGHFMASEGLAPTLPVAEPVAPEPAYYNYDEEAEAPEKGRHSTAMVAIMACAALLVGGGIGYLMGTSTQKSADEQIMQATIDSMNKEKAKVAQERDKAKDEAGKLHKKHEKLRDILLSEDGEFEESGDEDAVDESGSVDEEAEDGDATSTPAAGGGGASGGGAVRTIDEDGDVEVIEEDGGSDEAGADDSEHGKLGIRIVSTAEGVEIEEVTAGSPVEKAGVEDGDIILSVEGEEVKNIYDVISIISKHKPGDVVSVEFKDAGRQGITLQ